MLTTTPDTRPVDLTLYELHRLIGALGEDISGWAGRAHRSLWDAFPVEQTEAIGASHHGAQRGP